MQCRALWLKFNKMRAPGLAWTQPGAVLLGCGYLSWENGLVGKKHEITGILGFRDKSFPWLMELAKISRRLSSPVLPKSSLKLKGFQA